MLLTLIYSIIYREQESYMDTLRRLAHSTYACASSQVEEIIRPFADKNRISYSVYVLPLRPHYQVSRICFLADSIKHAIETSPTATDQATRIQYGTWKVGASTFFGTKDYHALTPLAKYRHMCEFAAHVREIVEYIKKIQMPAESRKVGA